MSLRPWCCIVEIRTGRVVLCDQSEVRAAEALEPGTCYAVAKTGTQATLEAQQAAAKFRAEGYA